MNCLTKNVNLYGNDVSLKNVWLFPVYVSTKHNLADEPSRKIHSQGEWMLARTIFSKALTFNITPKIDLFASRLNNQLPTYVSYKPDPNAYAVDAFSLDWSKLQFYAFPPFSCVSQCVHKKNKQSRRNTSNIPLADPTVLLKNNENDKATPSNNTSQCRKPCSSERLKKFVDSSSKDRFDGLSCVRERFLKKGLSNESTNIIMASWQKFTSIKYQVYINQWLDFCKNHNINSQNASVSNRLDFLAISKRKAIPHY